MGDLARVVVVHGQLFEDDAPLQLHVGLRQTGGRHHVGEEVDGAGQVLLDDLPVVVGDLFARGGVDGAAEIVDPLGDLLGAASPRSLEEEVFEEMGRAEAVHAFVGRSGAHPHPHGRRARVGTRSVRTLTPPGRIDRRTSAPSSTSRSSPPSTSKGRSTQENSLTGQV